MTKDFKRVLGNELLSGLPKRIHSTNELYKCVHAAMDEIQELIAQHKVKIEEVYTPDPRVKFIREHMPWGINNPW